MTILQTSCWGHHTSLKGISESKTYRTGVRLFMDNLTTAKWISYCCTTTVEGESLPLRGSGLSLVVVNKSLPITLLLWFLLWLSSVLKEVSGNLYLENSSLQTTHKATLPWPSQGNVRQDEQVGSFTCLDEMHVCGDRHCAVATTGSHPTSSISVGRVSRMLIRVELGLGCNHRGELLGGLLLGDRDAGGPQGRRGLHPGRHLPQVGSITAGRGPHGSAQTRRPLLRFSLPQQRPPNMLLLGLECLER